MQHQHDLPKRDEKKEIRAFFPEVLVVEENNQEMKTQHALSSVVSPSPARDASLHVAGSNCVFGPCEVLTLDNKGFNPKFTNPLLLGT